MNNTNPPEQGKSPLMLNETASLTEFLKSQISRIARLPEFAQHLDDGEWPYFPSGPDGSPLVRVAIAHARPDTDIWREVRSPASVGLHPLTFRDIWDYYAANTVTSVRPDGSPNYLAIPESFEEACGRFKRVSIVSALLPVHPQIFAEYARGIEQKNLLPGRACSIAMSQGKKILTTAMARLAMTLSSPQCASLCMDASGAGEVAKFTRAPAQSGKYHGPCNSPWPENSVVYLTGLMQFGVSRILLCDETGPDGKRVRHMGPYCSLVAFETAEPVTDGSGGVAFIDDAWLADRRRLADFTVTDPAVLKRRFCTYNQTAADGKSLCGKCIPACLSGAIGNSAPRPDGSWPERLAGQKHRFHEGFLKFDFGHCSNERNQKSTLYSEYACGRCLVSCAAAL